jgi:hypothetical protein
MARAHRYEMLPHVDALLALVEQADGPELMFREIIALLVNRAPPRSSWRPTSSAARTTSRASGGSGRP